MPKSTTPLVVPKYRYGNGTPTIGEIVLDMAQELLIDSLTQPNQLEVQLRRAKFVRQVNKTFAVEIKEEVRKKNAGEKGGLGRKAKIKEKDDELMPDLKKCMDSLKARKIRTSVAAIESEWARQKRLNLITIECPKIGKIRKLVNSLS